MKLWMVATMMRQGARARKNAEAFETGATTEEIGITKIDRLDMLTDKIFIPMIIGSAIVVFGFIIVLSVTSNLERKAARDLSALSEENAATIDVCLQERVLGDGIGKSWIQPEQVKYLTGEDGPSIIQSGHYYSLSFDLTNLSEEGEIDDAKIWIEYTDNLILDQIGYATIWYEGRNKQTALGEVAYCINRVEPVELSRGILSGENGHYSLDLIVSDVSEYPTDSIARPAVDNLDFIVYGSSAVVQ